MQAQEASLGQGLSVLNPLGRKDVQIKNRMATSVIDLTHDVIHELYWRPIERKPEEKPPDNVLKDKLLLKDWEQTKVNENFSWIYDRRVIDQEVFKRFQLLGETIKITADYRTLTNDAEFWKEERATQVATVQFINEFKKMKPYDTFEIKPETYDMKSQEQDKPKVDTTAKKESKAQEATSKKKNKFAEENAEEEENQDEASKLKKQDQGQ